MRKIKTLEFDDNVINKLRKIKNATNWPVVYIIYNEKEVYIGETINTAIRFNSHLSNDARRKLDKVTIIIDDTYNKSTILDLEAFLIEYMSADNKFKLQNGNSGIKNHNYYQREMYRNMFKDIWKDLKKRGLVNNGIELIDNMPLFKYSPYKSLSLDQYMTVKNILNTLIFDINRGKNDSLFLVNGGVGTGKTVLAIYLIKLLSLVGSIDYIDEDEDNDFFESLVQNHNLNDLKIALVVPMSNFRASLKKVFREAKGLDSKMVLSPNDVVKSDIVYDILIVDESHRLRRKVNLTQYETFNNNNKKLGLDDNGTELDWILKRSKHQIIFYDSRQTIRPTDVRKEDFNKLALRENYHSYFLETQLRCMLGGNEYIDYVYEIFSKNPPKKKIKFQQYDFKIYEDVNVMINDIKKKDKKYGLCRNIAGYAWPWKSKKNKNVCDIEIGEYKYIWNSKYTDWINSSNSVNEIGCIHTIQGYDLNYVGLIIGNDLKYDSVNKKIIVDRKNYFDVKGKNTTTDKELLNYLLNIYATMCTRGILGTYIYVCDEELREYLKKYIDVVNK